MILANLSADTHSWQVGNQVLLATTDLEIYVLYLRTSQSKIAQILHAAVVPGNANNVFNEKNALPSTLWLVQLQATRLSYSYPEK